MRILFIAALALSRLAAGAPLEFHAGSGEAAIMVLAQDAPVEDSTGEIAVLEANPIESLDDFTAAPDTSSEAMLEIYFRDYRTGTELRFPLLYSQVRDFLLLHPDGYRQDDLSERNVALIGDLVAHFKIHMKGPLLDQAGNGK